MHKTKDRRKAFFLITPDENIQELGIGDVHPVGRKDHTVKELRALSKAGSQPFPEASFTESKPPK